MAQGVQGIQYGGTETVWASCDGDGHVRIEIRRSDCTAILLTPSQAVELGNLLGELAAAACEVGRVTD